jgi:hypothetical protein
VQIHEDALAAVELPVPSPAAVLARPSPAAGQNPAAAASPAAAAPQPAAVAK